MAYKMLTSIFYKDLANIIAAYNMPDPVDIECNHITLQGQFLTKWDYAKRYEEDYGNEREMNYKVFLDMYEDVWHLPSFRACKN